MVTFFKDAGSFTSSVYMSQIMGLPTMQIVAIKNTSLMVGLCSLNIIDSVLAKKYTMYITD